MSHAAAVHQSLMLELVNAVENGNPATKVSTPSFGQSHTTLDDLLTDQFASPRDTVLFGLIELWAGALKGKDIPMRLKAQAMLATFAKQHADFHTDDAMSVLQILEDSAA